MGDEDRIVPQVRDQNTTEVVAELQRLRTEVRTLRREFHEFARVFLAAKFPYGKPVDRWSRP